MSRGARGGAFYCVDSLTGKRTSLGTTDRDAVLIETKAETLLEAIRRGTVSTNVHLRKLHNYGLDMGWLPWPIIPKRQWPAIRYAEKRAIRFDEHFAIIDREPNLERRAFYELCWHLGGAQGDIASLAAEDIDWDRRVIAYFRRKTESPALIRFGDDVERVLRQLPACGPLFPNLRGVRASDRATEFKQRCRGLGIEGVTLHSYRYAWAERAKTAGYPERLAQEALGHNSKAVHRAYARHAEVTLPALEEYERKATGRKVVPVRFNGPGSSAPAATEATTPSSAA